MAEFSHPPGPGIRREVDSYRLEASRIDKLCIQVRAIQSCGLIAELTSDGSDWIHLWATRRAKKVRRG